MIHTNYYGFICEFLLYTPRNQFKDFDAKHYFTVKKFCATTQFDATSAHNSGFKAPYTLAQGLHNTLHYEFINPNKDNITFESE